MSSTVRNIFPLFASLALRWAGGCPRCQRSMCKQKLTCNLDGNRIENMWKAQYLPQDKCEIEIGNLPLVLCQCTCILRISVEVAKKLTAFRGRKSIRLAGTLLWSCLPSPRAPSLRISSVNSGFCKYSCTNSWKFFIRTSSRSYCKHWQTVYNKHCWNVGCTEHC